MSWWQQYLLYAGIICGVLLFGGLVVSALMDSRVLGRSDRALLTAYGAAATGRVSVGYDPAAWAAALNSARTSDPDATEIIEAPNDDPCRDCGGRRCWAWRDSGHTRGCGNFPAPGNSYVGLREAAEHPGRHTVAETVRRWVGHGYNPLPLETRVRLAPTAWARRLPVPTTSAVTA